MAKRRGRPLLAVEDRRFGPILPAVTLVGVVLVTVIAAGWLGSPSEDPTATTEVPAIVEAASAEPLEWEQGALDVTAQPIAIVQLDDRYLFYGETRDDAPPEVWASADGLTWESLGVATGPSQSFRSLQATARGLLAVGTTGAWPDTRSALWQSVVGVEWRELALPDEIGSGEYEARTATATTDRVVVLGDGPHDRLEDRARRELVERGLVTHETLESMWFHLTGEGGRCVGVLEGPLQGASVTFDAEELGLTGADATRCYRGPSEATATYAWTKADGETWRRTELSKRAIGDVVVGSDGDLFAVDDDGGRLTVLRSEDGYSWSRQVLPVRSWTIRPWDRVGLLSVRDFSPTPSARSYLTPIAHSRDGEHWHDYSIPSLYLSPDYDWRFQGPAVGGAGALVVTLGEPVAGGGWDQATSPVALDKDGYRLVLSECWGTCWRLERDGVVLGSEFSDPAVGPALGLTVDHLALTVTISEQANGAALVEFTFDEIEYLRSRLFSTVQRPEERVQLLFSSDGVAWSVQDASELIGTGAFVEMTLVSADHVLIFTIEESEDGPPLTRVWVARVAASELGEMR